MVHLQVVAPEQFSSSSVEIELGAGAGEVEFDGARISWRIDSREPLDGPKRGCGRSVSTPTRSVRRSGCGIGSRETDFSPLAWHARSNCRTSSPIRRSRGIGGAGSSWRRRRTGRCFGWKGCGFRNGLSLQDRRFAACNGAGSGFNWLGCGFRPAMVSLPQPVQRCLTTTNIATTTRTPRRAASSGCRRVRWVVWIAILGGIVLLMLFKDRMEPPGDPLSQYQFQQLVDPTRSSRPPSTTTRKART